MTEFMVSAEHAAICRSVMESRIFECKLAAIESEFHQDDDCAAIHEMFDGAFRVLPARTPTPRIVDGNDGVQRFSDLVWFSEKHGEL